MKTSIIVSNFAALCLLVLFTDIPSLDWIKQTKLTASNEISYFPSQISSAETSAEPSKSLPVVSRKFVNKQVTADDSFRYLKFDVADYTKPGLSNEEVTTELPEPSVNNLECLKFDVNKYINFEDQADVITDLPEKDENTNNALSSAKSIEPMTNEFDYLKFDVNNFAAKDKSEDGEIGELPVKETNILSADATSSPKQAENEFNYLKFNVNKFYSTNEPGCDNIEEMPVPEESYTNK